MVECRVLIDFSWLGHGESITKVCLAHKIISRLEDGESPRDASSKSLKFMFDRVAGSGGCIVIDKHGRLVFFLHNLCYIKKHRLPWEFSENQFSKKHFTLQFTSQVHKYPLQTHCLKGSK